MAHNLTHRTMDQEIKNAIVEYVGCAALQLRQDEFARLQEEAARVPLLKVKLAESEVGLKDCSEEKIRLNSYISRWQAQNVENEKLLEIRGQKIAELTESNTFREQLCWGIALVAPVLGYFTARVLTHY